MRPPQLAGRILFFALLTVVATCDSPTDPGGSGSSRIEITPPSVQVELNATSELTATFRDGNGAVRSKVAIRWSTEDASIASVSSAGVVTGRTLGTTRVAASAEGVDTTVSVTVVPPTVASVAVSPARTELLDTETVQVRAIARDAGGRTIEGRSTTWSSTNLDVASVDETGLVTALAPGETKIIATVDGAAGEATVIVAARPVARVEVEPANLSLTVGSVHQFTATPRAADDAPLTGRRILWSSSNEKVLVISDGGEARAIAPGAARVTALVEGQSASSDVTVTVVPVASVEIAPTEAGLTVQQTQRFDVVVRAADGTMLSDRTVTWSSSRPQVASVSPAGLVTARTPGGTIITASAEGHSATATVEVRPRQVASVEIVPTSAALIVGTERQFAATPIAADGSELEGREVVWSIGHPDVASVDEEGLVRALLPGNTLVQARIGGKTATARLEVRRIPVATVEVSPPTFTLSIVQTRKLTITLRSENGAVLGNRQVEWSSDKDEVAEVDEHGVVTAHGVGEATITAVVEGKSGSARVTVTPRPVASVEIDPEDAVLVVGDRQRLAATPRASDGTALDGRRVVWSTSDDTVADVDQDGLVTAVGPGTAAIIANVDGTEGRAVVTILARPVASVELSPSSLDLIVGGSRQLIATARAADGQVLAGRLTGWSSSDTRVATVDASGLVTARAVGETNIRATIDGKSATAAVRVSPRPVAMVDVEPERATMLVGAMRQFVATARAEDGTILTGRTVLWSTSAGSVISVDAIGMVRALAPGSARVVATIEGRSGEASIVVELVPVAAVDVDPAVVSLMVSGTHRLEATVRGRDGSVLTDRTVEWSSTDPSVARVDDDGLVTALSPGSTTIVAMSGGISGSAKISVSPRPVAAVTVSPATASLYVTETRPFTAVARAADGAELDGRAIVWRSSNPAVVTVSETGTARAIATGTATLYAEVEDRRGSARITVTPAPIETITLTPSSAMLRPLQSVQFSVTLQAPNGSVITDRAVAWSSEHPLVANVSSDGTVTALFPGETTITARAEGREATARVVVAGGRR